MSPPYFLAALLAVLTTSSLALDEDFAFDVSDDLELEFAPEVPQKLWGMSDMTATVGHVFHLEIPKQAFGTDIQRYEVKRLDEKSLPTWLLFDKTSGTFWGVPTSEDVGSLHVVVRAVKKAEVVSNDFVLTVSEPKNPDEGPEKCSPSEDSTVLTLLIDKDIKSIKPKQRVVSINNIAKFFGLPYSAFSLEPQIKPDDISDSSVVLAGPGNLQSRRSKLTSLVQVPVGCDGRLWLKTASLVHQLKQQARDGTITEVLGLPLIGWRVKTETRSPLRNKRSASPKHIDGSGDDDTEEYDYYDGYDDYSYNDLEDSEIQEETPTKPPPSATTIPQIHSNTTSKMFPTTKLETSETHPHRHHHGEAKPVEEVEPTIKMANEPELGASPTTVEMTTTKVTESKIKPIPELPHTTSMTTEAPPSSTSKSTSAHVENETENSFKIDEYDYDTEYDDEEDEESQTEVPVILDKTKTEEVTEPIIKETTVSSSTEASTVKIQPETVEFVPETTPSVLQNTTLSSTTPIETTTKQQTTTTTTTTTTSTLPPLPVPEETTISEAPLTTAKEVITTVEETEASVTTTETPEIITTTPTTTTTTTTMTTTTTTTTEIPTVVQEETTTQKQTTVRHVTTQRPTTRAVTESIELGIKNLPPALQNRLKRTAVTAGKIFSYFIPIDTFMDLEDGTNLKLEFLDSEGRPVDNSSWCQFNPKTREIYGLPLEEDVSRWVYIIKATDSENASVSDRLEILVQHHKAKRAVNHEFSLYIQIEKKWEFPHLIDWPLKTLRGLGMVYHLTNLSDIVVRNIDYNSIPAVFTWTNDSLAKHYCPKDEIEKIFNILTSNNDGDPSYSLARALAPELKVKKVALLQLGVCESKPQPPPIPYTPPVNYSPILRNPVDHINATIGELLVFKVPDDTFYDPEDVDPRNLKMTLLTADRQPIPPDHWLQFDSKNKEFYGIPLPDDAGPREYQLVCEDSAGLPASDSLVVVVHAPPRKAYNVEFKMTLEIAYETFVHSASMQRKFVEKLQKLFNDKNTSYIQLSSISKSSTIVSWCNTSLNVEICPRDEIKTLESILVNNDRTIATRVQHIMDPEFPVSAIQLQLIGSCRGRPSIQTPEIAVPIDETTQPNSHDEYLITFIVPAVIIAAMLLLAGLAACVLYRRRRTGKMNVEEDGRASYGNKGIPVIFQEELDEKPESGTKAPVILKDEKPPLAPPEYSKSGSLKLTDDSEPYQPPPPFTRTQDNGRQSRPKPTPTYRKPPPYVPP